MLTTSLPSLHSLLKSLIFENLSDPRGLPRFYFLAGRAVRGNIVWFEKNVSYKKFRGIAIKLYITLRFYENILIFTIL